MTTMPAQPTTNGAAAPAAPRPGEPLLEVTNLVKHFPVRGGVFNRVVGRVHAVNGVSLTVSRGEILGVVGESGCGKSTLGKLVIRLIEPTSGSIKFAGREITGLGHAEMMPFRRKMQIVFQDPYSSLNPRMTVRAMLREAMLFHGVVEKSAVDDRIDQIIQTVGLRPDAAAKFPHEFSGGQRQRLGIARALALKPEFIVADEPVSALDVSIQAQVLNLMMGLKEEFGLTLLFISHDLKVVEHFCDRVMVMYLGRVVEYGSREHIYAQPTHPYTRLLLEAVPGTDPREERKRAPILIQGDLPSPFAPPDGCAFRTRCPRATADCARAVPQLREVTSGHYVACDRV